MDDVGNDLGIQVSEVEQRVPLAGPGKIDQPHETAGSHQHIFKVQIAVDDRLAALHHLVQPSRQSLERVGQAEALQAIRPAGEHRTPRPGH